MGKIFTGLTCIVFCCAAAQAKTVSGGGVTGGNVFNFNRPVPVLEPMPVTEPGPVIELPPVQEKGPALEAAPSFDSVPNVAGAEVAAEIISERPVAAQILNNIVQRENAALQKQNIVTQPQVTTPPPPATPAVSTPVPDVNTTSGNTIEISASPAVNSVPNGTLQVSVAAKTVQAPAPKKSAPQKVQAAVKKK